MRFSGGRHRACTAAREHPGPKIYSTAGCKRIHGAAYKWRGVEQRQQRMALAATGGKQAALVAELSRIVRAAATGARVSVRSSDTVVVTYIDVWTQAFTDELHVTHPNAHIVITAAEASGGIKVVVTQKRTIMSRTRNLMLLLGCFLAGLSILVYVLGQTFDDNFVTPNPWLRQNTTRAWEVNATQTQTAPPLPPQSQCASAKRVR